MIANLRLEVNQPAARNGAADDPGRQRAPVGLLGALLRRADEGRTEDRRLHVHRLRPARLRHIRADQATRDRLLVGADQRARRETRSRPATSQCRSRRSCPSGARSGSATARAASTCCAWRPTSGPARRTRQRRGGTRDCSSRRRFTARVRLPRQARVRSIRVTLNGRTVRGARRAGSFVRVTVDLRGLSKTRPCASGCACGAGEPSTPMACTTPVRGAIRRSSGTMGASSFALAGSSRCWHSPRRRGVRPRRPSRRPTRCHATPCQDMSRWPATARSG